MEESVKKSTASEAVIVGAKLLLICALVAGIISFVYALTAEKYEQNIQETKNQALGNIFSLEAPESKLLADGDAVINGVYASDISVGYCVEVKRSGFGGDVELMVGFDLDGKVVGVSVVAHSETPGFGARVAEEAFLGQYVGQSGDLVLGEDIDAIAGATISSTAVTDAVNAARAALETYLKEEVHP